MVEAVAVVIEAGFDVVVFCRETMAEEVGERPGLGDDVAEGVVGVLRDGVAVGIEVARNITDVIIAWNVDSSINCKVKQSANAACRLKCAREVFAPVVVDCRRITIRVGDALLYEVPVVVEESRRRLGRDFPHAA